MSANDDLILWNSRWKLSKSTVYCRTCGAVQSESDKSTVFEHQAGCGNAGQGTRPWDDLDAILATFKKDSSRSENGC